METWRDRKDIVVRSASVDFGEEDCPANVVDVGIEEGKAPILIGVGMTNTAEVRWIERLVDISNLLWRCRGKDSADKAIKGCLRIALWANK